MQVDSSSECRTHVRHRDEDARRVLRVLKGMEAKALIEAEAPVEAIVLEHIKDDGRCPHLIGNSKATPHGIHDKGSSEPFALHILAHRNCADIDDGNIRYTGALPLVGSKIRADGHCAKGIETEDGRITVGRRNPRGDHPGLDLVGER